VPTWIGDPPPRSLFCARVAAVVKTGAGMVYWKRDLWVAKVRGQCAPMLSRVFPSRAEVQDALRSHGKTNQPCKGTAPSDLHNLGSFLVAVSQ
jgi:hypothetical protein